MQKAVVAISTLCSLYEVNVPEEAQRRRQDSIQTAVEEKQSQCEDTGMATYALSGPGAKMPITKAKKKAMHRAMMIGETPISVELAAFLNATFASLSVR